MYMYSIFIFYYNYVLYFLFPGKHFFHCYYFRFVIIVSGVSLLMVHSIDKQILAIMYVCTVGPNRFSFPK